MCLLLVWNVGIFNSKGKMQHEIVAKNMYRYSCIHSLTVAKETVPFDDRRVAAHGMHTFGCAVAFVLQVVRLSSDSTRQKSEDFKELEIVFFLLQCTCEPNICLDKHPNFNWKTKAPKWALWDLWQPLLSIFCKISTGPISKNVPLDELVLHNQSWGGGTCHVQRDRQPDRR